MHPQETAASSIVSGSARTRKYSRWLRTDTTPTNETDYHINCSGEEHRTRRLCPTFYLEAGNLHNCRQGRDEPVDRTENQPVSRRTGEI
jgi:hypothetical protein